MNKILIRGFGKFQYTSENLEGHIAMQGYVHDQERCLNVLALADLLSL